jgi:hypothetical protein
MMRRKQRFWILGCSFLFGFGPLGAEIPEDWRRNLPEPVLPAHPDWVEFYYDAWRIAGDRKQQRDGQWIFDTAFDPNKTWLWDSCWILEFGKYVQGAHPDIKNPAAALDLFYGQQQKDGFISHVWPEQIESVHNPILAMAELSYYRHFGDRKRLRLVLPKLDRLFQSVEQRAGSPSGLYRNTAWNNGMDNRPSADFIIDLTAEQALAARQLSEIAGLVGDASRSGHYAKKYRGLKALINDRMWSEKDGFYTDVNSLMKPVNHWTIAAFWPLLAKVADPARAERVIAVLNDPEHFNTPHRIPSLGRKSPAYHRDGGDYWRGSVWVPTNTMVIRGLEEYGRFGLAREIAENHVAAMCRTWRGTRTIWENYDPERTERPGNTAKRDFVGWSGVMPIATLIETVIGIRVDTPARTMTWHLRPREIHGIRNVRWGSEGTIRTDLLAEPANGSDHSMKLKIATTAAFTLVVTSPQGTRRWSIPEGGQTLLLP